MSASSCRGGGSSGGGGGSSGGCCHACCARCLRVNICMPAQRLAENYTAGHLYLHKRVFDLKLLRWPGVGCTSYGVNLSLPCPPAGFPDAPIGLMIAANVVCRAGGGRESAVPSMHIQLPARLAREVVCPSPACRSSLIHSRQCPQGSAPPAIPSPPTCRPSCCTWSAPTR